MGGKFGKDESHAVYANWEHLHTSVGSFDGGKCVGAHEYYYKECDSCSYRWQAHHRATGADSGHYGAWQGVLGFRERATKEAANLLRNKALNAAPVAKPGDPDRSTVAGLPFRTGFAPWNNNAHHMLADAELRDGIFGAAGDNAQAQDLIIKGLLDKNYNINHWRNMMILPQDQKIGCQLSLPTHPQGDSHPAYSAKIKAKVDAALKVYQPIVKKMNDGTFDKNHEVPDPLDIVDALMAISDSVHAEIIALKPVIAARCQATESIAINQFASQVATALGV
jgi:hypothetical protein